MNEKDIELFKMALQATGISFEVEVRPDSSVIFSVPCHMNTVDFQYCNGGSMHVVSALGTISTDQEYHVLRFLNQLMIKNPYLQLTLQDQEIICRCTFSLPYGTEEERYDYFSIHIAMLMALFNWATHETYVLRENAD